MARAKKYWLMKCEPAAYTIDDLARDGVTGWEGVRNYQARNYMRDDMKPGDGVLFYASNAEPSGVVGLAEIAKGGYPDPFAFKKGHRYHDEKSKKDEPTWYTVDIRFVEKFADVVPLDELREQRSLAKMMVLQKGSRLSIQPVGKAHYDAVVKLGHDKAKALKARLSTRLRRGRRPLLPDREPDHGDGAVGELGLEGQWGAELRALLDFLGTFRTGGRPSAPQPAEPTPTGG